MYYRPLPYQECRISHFKRDSCFCEENTWNTEVTILFGQDLRYGVWYTLDDVQANQNKNVKKLCLWKKKKKKGRRVNGIKWIFGVQRRGGHFLSMWEWYVTTEPYCGKGYNPEVNTFDECPTTPYHIQHCVWQ